MTASEYRIHLRGLSGDIRAILEEKIEICKELGYNALAHENKEFARICYEKANAFRKAIECVENEIKNNIKISYVYDKEDEQ